MTRALLLVVLVAALLGGCGGEEPTGAVTETVTAPAAATPPASETTPKEPAPEPEPEPEPVAKKITVPDVVGENHQDAQDRMQSKGLFNLREEDATGLERLLVLDSNWEVVSQKLAAGKRVGEDTTITLSSKKIGE